jgi:uncharacterized protein (TIGR02099 family)
MLARISRRIYHACWYTFAAIILITAVLVTLVRLSLPHINDHRVNIEQWISSNVGYPVRIEHIDAAWQGWTPYLYLNGITVFDKSGKAIAAGLKSVQISINPYISLLQWEIAPLKITVTGPDLSVIRDHDGSIGLMQHDFSRDEIIQNNIFADWLLLHKSISIEDATINYIDLNKSGSSLLLTDVDLDFKKSSVRMQINVSAVLPENYGKRLDLMLDIYGDITTPKWSGQMFIEGQQIYPDNILEHIQDNVPLILTGAPANIKLWSSWDQGNLSKLDGQIAATDIKMEYENTSLTLPQIAASFSVIFQQKNGFRAKFNIDNLITENGTWQQSTIELFRQVNQDPDNILYISRASYLNIDDIIPLINKLYPDYYFLDNNSLKLHGSLKNSLIIYEPENSRIVHFDTDMEDVRLGFEKDSVISNTGLHLSGNLEQGLITFDSPLMSFIFPDHFEDELKFYEVTGDVKWQQNTDNLTFETGHIESHTPHFHTTARGKIIFDSNNARPYTLLRINANNIGIADIAHYLPLALPESARSWIRQSLVSGEVSSLDIIQRGYLDEFPYRDNSGQFKMQASMKNTILDFSPKWMPVNNLNAVLEINNTQLNFQAKAGQMYNAELKNVTARIDDLSVDQKILEIEGDAYGNTQDAAYIIENSPLSGSEMFSKFNVKDFNGALALKLKLDIPFYDSHTTFDGKLYFDDVVFNSEKYKITLNDITGDILFARDHVTTDRLTANYFSKPVNLIISTDNQSRLISTLEGDADAEFISKQLTYFFPELESIAEQIKNYMNGICNWTATITSINKMIGEIQTEEDLLAIKSSLSGLSINLPPPVGKKYTPQLLEINTVLSNQPKQDILFRYGDKLTGNFKLHKRDNLNKLNAELALGPGAKLLNTGQGLLIHGQLDELNLSEWYNLIQSLDLKLHVDNGEEINIDLNASNLVYYDQAFDNTGITIKNNGADWQVNVAGKDVEGDVNIPADTNINIVTANFKKLHLKRDDENKRESGIDPRTQPSLELTAEEFKYGSFELGEMVLSTSRVANGLSINSITFKKPKLEITGKGTWEYINEEEFSNFDFKLKADQMHTMLNAFDYSVNPIKDGETRLKMNALWHGSPMDFSLANINGSLTMEIEKGRVLDIEPSAGRLFGLLSLQTLSRRLSLDFSDLFKKGFTFDQIEGTFTIESGNAYTNNLTMAGPSAKIDITGRTGLIEKDYDQIVTVTPQVSDSLPLASALFGPIGVGVGAVIFLAGELFDTIPKQIDKLLRYQYTISGSWDNPVVEKFDTNTKPSG